MPWFIPLLIGIGLSIVSQLLMPKPKTPKPPAAQDLEEPTADANKPVCVIFGTITIKGLNVLHSGDKSIRNYQVKA